MTTDFAATKRQFHLPEGLIYLDGNSLGPLPKTAAARVAQAITGEWGEMLIRGWNKAGWMDMPTKVGNRVARLIGAEAGHVVMGDTLSIKVYQALASALQLAPSRRVILSDTGNFPSDLYMAQGLAQTLGADYRLKTVAPEAVLAAVDETVAVVMITEVDYRSGRRHDMAALSKRAHEVGALIVWDLAHSAGAFPLNVAKDGADFAVGCSYKYLNSGPGGLPLSMWPRAMRIGCNRPCRAGWATMRPLPLTPTIAPPQVLNGCGWAHRPYCNLRLWKRH
jgi:kynureninase